MLSIKNYTVKKKLFNKKENVKDVKDVTLLATSDSDVFPDKTLKEKILFWKKIFEIKE